MSDEDIQEALDSGRWRLSSDEEERKKMEAYVRKPLTATGQFISDSLDEEDPQHFIKAGDKPGCYHSFVEDIMDELDSARNEKDILAIIMVAFTKGSLPAVIWQGGQRYIVVEYTDEDYETADMLVGGSELYKGAAKKIWAYVSQTKK